ncbi:hypothetical protein QAD02_016379 [Eretmocerus hayati]|uniref:Uncharacterized protein n=1 Tax=Eretmocerus hayati TaxID=131215 RepID=A0ACC2PDR9_9HYME|nr:hypothetical protein QAD02_016379 [Eretmocerus hayati]
MGFQDALNYALFTNPISAHTLQITKATVDGVSNLIGLKPKTVEVIKMVPPEPLWKLASATGPFVRLAALSGAAAVILGAYGSHKNYPDEKGQEQRRVFDTASRYHFIHTLALLGMPLCRMPYLAGTFMLSGIVLFSGTCYYYAFTGKRTYSRLTPIGGTCFILGWLGMMI